MKVNYVKKMQLGGVIVWSYDMDGNFLVEQHRRKRYNR